MRKTMAVIKSPTQIREEQARGLISLLERIKKEEPEILVRFSDMQPLSDKPVLKSADRAGYYITAKEF